MKSAFNSDSTSDFSDNFSYDNYSEDEYSSGREGFSEALAPEFNGLSSATETLDQDTVEYSTTDYSESWKPEHENSMQADEFITDMLSLSASVKASMDYCDETIENNYDYYDDVDADAEAWRIEIETARQLVNPSQVLATALTEARVRDFFTYEGHSDFEAQIQNVLNEAYEFVSRVRASLEEIQDSDSEDGEETSRQIEELGVLGAEFDLDCENSGFVEEYEETDDLEQLEESED